MNTPWQPGHSAQVHLKFKSTPCCSTMPISSIFCLSIFLLVTCSVVFCGIRLSLLPWLGGHAAGEAPRGAARRFWLGRAGPPVRGRAGGAAAGPPARSPSRAALGQRCRAWGHSCCVPEKRAGGFESLPVRFTLDSISR